MVTAKTEQLTLASVWGLRLSLRAEGSRLMAEGDKLMAKGSRLWDEGSRLRDEGDKLRAEGSRIWAKGDKLSSDGSRLWDAGDKLWTNAVLAVQGTTAMRWEPVDGQSNKRCVLETGAVFEP